MSRVLLSLIAISRRAYSTAMAVESTAMAVESTAVAENARRAAGVTMGTAAESGAKSAKKEIFWMRDPKTGNWLPENRFNDVDPAELRARYLEKN